LRAAACVLAEVGRKYAFPDRLVWLGHSREVCLGVEVEVEVQFGLHRDMEVVVVRVALQAEAEAAVVPLLATTYAQDAYGNQCC